MPSTGAGLGRGQAWRAPRVLDNGSGERIAQPLSAGRAALAEPAHAARLFFLENIFGEAYVYQSAFALGALGAVLLFIGMKHEGEVAGTWYGFWAGTFLWTGWVEFAFVWNANFLGVPDLMDAHMAGEIARVARASPTNLPRFRRIRWRSTTDSRPPR